MAGKEWPSELLPNKELAPIKEHLHISPGAIGLEVRSDIPEALCGRVLHRLVQMYRAMFGEEPEGIHKLAVPEAIGLLELSIRTCEKMVLPLAKREKAETNTFPMSTTGAYHR